MASKTSRLKGQKGPKRPTDSELAAWIGQELSSADGWDDDSWSGNMQSAMDYYLLRPRGDEEEGKSAVISSDVADMVEAILSQMAPSFAGDSVVTFDALNDADETQAQLESDVVSQIIMEDNRGFYVFLESIKDALLLKNGIIKVFVEEDTTRQTETFEGLSEIEFLQASQGNGETTAKVLDAEADDQGLITARIAFTTVTKTLIVRSIAPENIGIEQGYDSIFLDRCNFFFERHQNTRSEMIELGMPKKVVMQLNTMTPTDSSSTMRNLRQEQPERTANQAAQENIEWFECYYKVDMNGDGVTELIKAAVAGPDSTQMIQWEFVDFIPYASGSPFINPHRWLGYSIYDKEAGVQDVKTAALRQWLDNAGNNNVNRATVLEGQVHMGDAKNNRSSGLIRIKSPQAYMPIPINDIGPSMQSLLSYMDQMRAERGGASLELQSGEAQLGASIGSQDLDSAYSTKEQLAGLMTRTLAETLIRTTYLLVHRTARSQLTAEINIKRAGEWVQTDPTTWPERNRVNIKIGLSPQDRQRKSANLEKTMQAQLGLMQQYDGVLVDLTKVHNSIIDWSRSADMDAPEQYWIDPESPQAQQAMQGKQQAAQQAEQASQQQQQQFIQMNAQLEQAKIASEDWQQMIQTQEDYFEATLKSQTEEFKVMGAEVARQLDALQNVGIAESQEVGSSVNNGSGSPGS